MSILIWTADTGIAAIFRPSPNYTGTLEDAATLVVPVVTLKDCEMYVWKNVTENGVVVEKIRGVRTIPTGSYVEPREAFRVGVPVSNIPYEIIEESDLPTDTLLRNAWEHDTSASPKKIKLNLPKAKARAHEIRREKRAMEFMPIDENKPNIALVPAAEALRQPIRDKYAAMQAAIDAAKTEAQLKKALG